VKLTVNGNPRDVADSPTVAALLEQLDLAGKFVAVEVNLELIPKKLYATASSPIEGTIVG